MLAQEGMTPKDIEIIEMAPPDMPAALYAKAVDAYCTGEPFGAAAQRAGYARAAAHDARRMAQLHLLRADRARGADQGEPRRWCRSSSTTCSAPAPGSTSSRPTATRRSTIAAGRKFFNQDPNILQFVMENPTDRVTYGDLRMIRAEFEELMQLSIEAGTHQGARPLREVRGRQLRQGRRDPPRSRCDARSGEAMPVARIAAVLLLLALACAAGASAQRRPQGRRLRARRGRRPTSRCAAPTARELKLAAIAARSWCWRSASRHCPAVCPTTLATLAAGAQETRARPAQLQVVYVTVDPERDDAARMRSYLAASTRFVGGTGTPERWRPCARSYGVTARKAGRRRRTTCMRHSSFDLPHRPRGQAARADAVRHRADDFVHDLSAAAAADE